MTPKEKVRELYRKYRGFNVESESMNHVTAIQCAELCIDEILNSLYRSSPIDQKLEQPYVEYWKEVKKELENL